jgi:hypothetical protein
MGRKHSQECPLGLLRQGKRHLGDTAVHLMMKLGTNTHRELDRVELSFSRASDHHKLWVRPDAQA